MEVVMIVFLLWLVFGMAPVPHYDRIPIAQDDREVSGEVITPTPGWVPRPPRRYIRHR